MKYWGSLKVIGTAPSGSCWEERCRRDRIDPKAAEDAIEVFPAYGLRVKAIQHPDGTYTTYRMQRDGRVERCWRSVPANRIRRENSR